VSTQVFLIGYACLMGLILAVFAFAMWRLNVVHSEFSRIIKSCNNLTELYTYKAFRDSTDVDHMIWSFRNPKSFYPKWLEKRGNS